MAILSLLFLVGAAHAQRSINGRTRLSWAINAYRRNPERAERIYGPIEDWDTSEVTNFNRIFKGETFDADISAWDTSAVTSMDSTFENSEFTSDISAWDTSSVGDMGEAFKKSTFAGDISAWDTSSVTSMVSMFEGTAFNGDISAWDTSNVRKMSFMFQQRRSSRIYDVPEGEGPLPSFNGDISGWNVALVKEFDLMFHNARDFNGDLSAWNVESGRDFRRMFNGANAFNADITGWNVAEARNMNAMFGLDEEQAFNQDLTLWQPTKVRDAVIFGIVKERCTEFCYSCGLPNVWRKKFGCRRKCGAKFTQFFFPRKSRTVDSGEPEEKEVCYCPAPDQLQSEDERRLCVAQPTPAPGTLEKCQDNCGSVAAYKTPAGAECFCDPACAFWKDCCTPGGSLEEYISDCGSEVAANTCAGNDNAGVARCESEGEGGIPPAFGFDACRCDDDCADYNDCCADKVAVCGGEGPAETPSCEGRCYADNMDAPQVWNLDSCRCGNGCEQHGDCCADFADFCGAEVSSTAVCTAELCAATGIAARAGDSPANYCYCDSDAATRGFACSNFVEACSGAAVEAVEAAEEEEADAATED